MPAQAHHRRLQSIVEHTTNMVVVTNRRRGIEWVNPAYTRVTGWTLDEVRGRNPRSFLHGPRTSWSAAARLGDLLRQGQEVSDFELLNYKKNGEPYWVSLNIRPIRDAQGEVVEYVSIQSDITERKRREMELQRAHWRLAQAQRLGRFGWLEHDLATGRVLCPPDVCELLGLPPAAERDAHALLDLVHRDDRLRVRRSYLHAVNGGGEFSCDLRLAGAAGRTRWVHLQGALEGWEDGTPATMRLVVQDITDRQLAAQTAREKDLLEQASRAQTDVLSRISHELRTPLHAVLGFAEILERMEAAHLSAQACGHLRHIREAARHLLAIVNDILDLIRLRGAVAVADVRPVDLHALALDVTAMLQPLADRRGVHLHVPAPGGATWAGADPRRLRQVLINLVANAIKYNRPDGQVQVFVVPTGDGRLAVDVVDTGLGIAPADLPHLFEPFYRAHESDSLTEADRGPSSGLGLAIAKTLVDSMSGDLQALSVLGEGSTFRVLLPGATASAPTSTSAPGAPAPTSAKAARAARVARTAPRHDPGSSGDGRRRQPVRVLYIDDNEVNTLVLQGQVQAHARVQLSTSSTGATGLAAARALKPDLVIIDIHLPDMSGHDVLRAIQADPELFRTPCAACSADDSQAAIDTAVRLGFREYLPKPLPVDSLLDLIDRLVDPVPSLALG